jgi:hypothetical protein
MHVQSADGKDLGKITTIYYGTDPTPSSPLCDEELCSRLEVHRGLLGREVLYIPYSALVSVEGQVVRLNVEASQVADQEDWHHKPRWIEAT